MNTPETEKAGPTLTEHLAMEQDKPKRAPTYVDNAGRPVNPDEVRPVKPIELETPESMLVKERAALKEAREHVARLEAKLREVYADCKTAVDLAAAANKDLLEKKKRIAEIAAQRNLWERRALAAEARPTPEGLKEIQEDRNHLRSEVAGKDKEISRLTTELHKVAGDAGGAVREARVAEQRAKDRAESVLATLESMQRARDKAEKEREITQAEKGKLIEASANWRIRAEAAEKELAELKKPKTTAPAGK
jgi:chromosome segregation ATPase